MKEFVSFCQRYCPHPTDSIATSDSRVVALRRLINMTSEIDAPTFPIERLLENESDKFLLSRYRLPAINSHLAEESADEEDDEEISDTDQPYHASSNNLKHSLLTSVSGDDNNHHEEEVEERF